MKKKKQTKLEEAKQKAKALAKGKKKRAKLTKEEKIEQAKVQKMAYTYEEALAKYKNKPTLKYVKKMLTPEDQPVYSLWLRAAYMAEESGCSYKTFIAAQFYYFDKWFNKAPSPQNCVTHKTKTPAIKRVEMYLDMLEEEPEEAEKEVVSRVIEAPKISNSVKYRHCEQALRQFMKSYNLTEEEALRKFASGKRANLYFDRTWLMNNETYLRLREAGEV